MQATQTIAQPSIVKPAIASTRPVIRHASKTTSDGGAFGIFDGFAFVGTATVFCGLLVAIALLTPLALAASAIAGLSSGGRTPGPAWRKVDA